MLSAVVLLLILIGLPETRGTLGQVQGLNREHMLKAVYLYKFATYIRWPDEAFSSSTSPFVIGVLGPDPVGVHLRKIAAVKNINGRKIELRTYETPDEVRDCHILFMSRGLDNENQSSAVRQLSRRNILFVGEDNSFLERGGVVDFVVHENRIRVLISRSAYEREGLKISAQLLRVAEVVD